MDLHPDSDRQRTDQPRTEASLGRGLPTPAEVRAQSRARNLELSGAPTHADVFGQTVRYVIVIDEHGNERVVEDRAPFLNL